MDSLHRFLRYAVNYEVFDIFIEKPLQKVYNVRIPSYNFGVSDMIAFEKLPPAFQNDEVRPYYDHLSKRTGALVLKRVFDIAVSLVLLIFLILPIGVIALLVRLDSEGPVFFRQERVTAYGKHFRIFKFRTMVVNAESLGTMVTTNSDSRVTRVGKTLRKYRLDELPQIFNVLGGTMSFVGTRPEVVKYVGQYKPVYYATLLMPAGITSLASIRYKDEEKLLSAGDDTDAVYLNVVLPEKMKYNLEYVETFRFFNDIKLMFQTVKEVF